MSTDFIKDFCIHNIVKDIIDDCCYIKMTPEERNDYKQFIEKISKNHYEEIIHYISEQAGKPCDISYNEFIETINLKLKLNI